MAIKNLYFFLVISCLAVINIGASGQAKYNWPQELKLLSPQTIMFSWQMSARTIGGQSIEFCFKEYEDLLKNNEDLFKYIPHPDEKINFLQLFGRSLYFACTSFYVHQIGSLITIHLLARKRYSQGKSTVLLAAHGVPLVQLEDAVGFFSISSCWLLWYFFNREMKEHGLIEMGKIMIIDQLCSSISNIIIYGMHKGIEKGLQRIKPKWNDKLQQMPHWAQLWARYISKAMVYGYLTTLYCVATKQDSLV